MYTFIEADNLDKKAESNAKKTKMWGQTDLDNGAVQALRRPYRGIQIKGDTYAAISIWSGSEAFHILKTESAYASSGTGGVGTAVSYFDFILQSVDDNRQEKMQVMETFGDPYVFFYGERPRFVTFRGVLLNTEDFNWRSQFWDNYDKYLRGTKLVEMGARAYLSYDSIVIEGYPITAQATDTADSPYIIPFGLTMLVTNYFDFSDIGQTAFPGPKTPDNNALNKELDLINKNREYVSTGAAVRAKNMTASPGGFLSEIRQGIRAVNQITGAVSNFVDTVQNIVGGRNVRLPIGIAGYLSNVGAAVTAGGSIGNEFDQTMWDAKTGMYRSITGSIKLRMPGSAWFTSTEPGEIKSRGFKFDNVDEYPLRSDDSTYLKDLLSMGQYTALEKRILRRFVAASEEDIALEKWNLQAEAGGLISNIADGVSALKNGFGMVMSAIAFCKDPLGVLKASLGISAGYFDIKNLETRFENRFSGSGSETAKVYPDGISGHYPEWTKSPTMIKQKMEELGLENLSPEAQVELEKRLGTDAFSSNSAEYIRRTLAQQGFTELAEAAGATSKSDTSFSERQSYIGSKAKEQNQKFGTVLENEKLKIDLFGDPDTEIDVGIVYESSQYLPASTDIQYRKQFLESANYEEAYGDNDYTSLALQSTGAAEAIQTIREAYDDVFINQPSEITEQSIEEVYGVGYQSTQVRSAAEIANLLRSMFGGQEQENESQEGIRGIDDEDAAIEPVR